MSSSFNGSWGLAVGRGLCAAIVEAGTDSYRAQTKAHAEQAATL